jgi:hypothetical protein
MAPRVAFVCVMEVEILDNDELRVVAKVSKSETFVLIVDNVVLIVDKLVFVVVNVVFVVLTLEEIVLQFVLILERDELPVV